MSVDNVSNNDENEPADNRGPRPGSGGVIVQIADGDVYAIVSPRLSIIFSSPREYTENDLRAAETVAFELIVAAESPTPLVVELPFPIRVGGDAAPSTRPAGAATFWRSSRPAFAVGDMVQLTEDCTFESPVGEPIRIPARSLATVRSTTPDGRVEVFAMGGAGVVSASQLRRL